MIDKLLGAQIRAFEKHYDYDMSYAHRIPSRGVPALLAVLALRPGARGGAGRTVVRGAHRRHPL
ncbi:MAG: hypothetical protein IPG43_08330 [Proteobacteria bacterium]|nr:hypothetical protein [Pseudomonadota bacterium]